MPVLSPQIRYEEVDGPSSDAVHGSSLTHLEPQREDAVILRP
jgi:hypothetical protein